MGPSRTRLSSRVLGHRRTMRLLRRTIVYGTAYCMTLAQLARNAVKQARKRRFLWVRLLDQARLTVSAPGRAVLFTRLVHRHQIHQTTPYTCNERYPALFDLAAKLAPKATRILSFGCSTGEELVALRRRFPDAELIGAEINPRSRRLAARLLSADGATVVVHPNVIAGPFDFVFALAVLQREPHKVAEMEVDKLTRYYPFERFNSAIRDFAEWLRPGGFLCVFHAQYRVEDSSVARQFKPVPRSPQLHQPLFGPNGRPLAGATAHSIFRKRDKSAF